MLSTGGVGASRATVNEYAIGLRPAIRIVDVDPLALGERPAQDEARAAAGRCTHGTRPSQVPLAEPTTRTESIRLGDTPRMLIWVSGEASGVPGSGEIVTGVTGFAAGATGREEKVLPLAPAVAAAPAGTRKAAADSRALSDTLSDSTAQLIDDS